MVAVCLPAGLPAASSPCADLPPPSLVEAELIQGFGGPWAKKIIVRGEPFLLSLTSPLNRSHNVNNVQ